MKSSVYCALVFSCVAPGLLPAATPVELTGSLGASVGFDDNLYLQDDGPLAAGQTVASLPAHEFSGVLQGSLSVAVKQKTTHWLWSASYAPELFHFIDHTTENHTDHKWAAALSGGAEEWSVLAKLSGLEVDGAEEGPTYNRLGGGPPIGGVPVRARRSQGFYKGAVTLTHESDRMITRAVVNGALTDFRSVQKTTAGYSNYVDRSEWTLGPDIGRKLGADRLVFVGARYGKQIQEDLFNVPLNSSSTIWRLLAGHEGKLGAWTLTGAIGVDYRSMTESRHAGSERDRSIPYADISASRSFGKTDSVSANFRQGMVLGGGGRSAYDDTMVELLWKRQWSSKWDTTLGGSFDYADFKDMISSPKREWIATINAVSGWAVSKTLRIEAALVRDWSGTRIANTPGREYHRWQGRFGGVWKW